MNNMLLATRLKNRRQELKLSQEELANGICDQGQISRIEQGRYTPGSELLYQLSNRLNVDMNYFFDETISENKQSLSNFKVLVKKFLEHRDYESLKYIYDLEISKQTKLSISDQIYLKWINSIIDFYLEDKKDLAIKELEKLINEVPRTNFCYLQIANTLINFYFETNQMVEFKNTHRMVEPQLKKVSIKTLEDVELIIKFKYNYSRYLWLNKKNEESVNEITEAIEFCKKHRSMYLLADLYCLLGNVSENFLGKEKAKSYFEIARILYKIDDNQKMILKIERHSAGNLSDY